MLRKAKPELTVAEASQLTGKSTATVYRWIRDDRLPTIDTPAGPLLRTADVLKVAASTRPGRPRETRPPASSP